MRRTVASLAVVIIIVAAVVSALWLNGRGGTGDGAAGGPGSSGTSPTRASATRTPTLKPSAKPTTAKPKPKPSKPTATPTKRPPAGVPARPKNAQKMKVTYVYDGDTVQLQSAKPGRYVTTVNKIKVRLIGVDTPEMTPKKQCYAQQATDQLRKLAKPGSTVWVAPDRDSWDDYRRRLFMVWTSDGTLIDHALIKGGYGKALRIYPNITYWPLYEKTQKDAQRGKKGLWGAC